MIVDTSVVVALLLSEPDAPVLTRLMSTAPTRRLSSASYVELGAVIDGRRDPALSGALDAILRVLHIEVVPFTVEQARIARVAYQQFGRGSGHPAQLNMGDCFAYALARDLGEPLLFKGRRLRPDRHRARRRADQEQAPERGRGGVRGRGGLTRRSRVSLGRHESPEPQSSFPLRSAVTLQPSAPGAWR